MFGAVTSKINLNKKEAVKNFIKYKQLYLIIIPAVIYVFIFSFLPMYGVTLAFKEYRFDKGLFLSPWVGLKVFKSFFSVFNFWQLIRNTLVVNFFKIFVYFPVPIIFALFLNEIRSVAFKKIVQTVSYLPNFISWVIVVVMLQQFIGLDGLLNQFRLILGMDKVFYLYEKEYFNAIMFLSHTWKSFGIGSIIYLAAITSIDPELFEASVIDGANRFKQMWYITLPCISGTILILFILGLAGILSTGWDQIYLLSSPGNTEISTTIDIFVINRGITAGDFSMATAVSLFQSIMGLFLILGTNYVARKTTDYGLW